MAQLPSQCCEPRPSWWGGRVCVAGWVGNGQGLTWDTWMRWWGSVWQSSLRSGLWFLPSGYRYLEV